MAEEEKKEVQKKSEKCGCDCRVFLISLLTSIIVVLVFHIGNKAFRILCASCRAKARPAACCCMAPKCGRPGKPFCGPKGFPGKPFHGPKAIPGKCDRGPASCPANMPKPPAPAPAPAPTK